MQQNYVAEKKLHNFFECIELIIKKSDRMRAYKN